MRRYKWILFVFVVFAAILIVARYISWQIGINFRVTYLLVMLATWVAMSIIVAVQRSRLAARFEQLAAPHRRTLANVYPELRYMTAKPQGDLSARAATWIGVVAVNGPVIPIMVGPVFVAERIFGSPIPILPGAGSLLLGFFLAWSWWSVTATLWRRWATRRGVDPDELQWRGESATLFVPRGHIFEKTELGQLLKLAAKRRRK